jgi:hypothetical protein
LRSCQEEGVAEEGVAGVTGVQELQNGWQLRRALRLGDGFFAIPVNFTLAFAISSPSSFIAKEEERSLD